MRAEDAYAGRLEEGISPPSGFCMAASALAPTDARLVGLRELTRFRADLVGAAYDGPQHLAGGAGPRLPGAADYLQTAPAAAPFGLARDLPHRRGRGQCFTGAADH